MEKIKNIVGNTPLFIGLGILYVAVGVKKVADGLFGLSFTLHEVLKTEVGVKITAAKEHMQEVVNQMKAQQQAANGDDGKLLRVIKQDLPNGVFQIGKKPTTDN